jgi:hypothetical protein
MIIAQVLVEARYWEIAVGSYVYRIEIRQVNIGLKDSGRDRETLGTIGKNLWN